MVVDVGGDAVLNIIHIDDGGVGLLVLGQYTPSAPKTATL